MSVNKSWCQQDYDQGDYDYDYNDNGDDDDDYDGKSGTSLGSMYRCI